MTERKIAIVGGAGYVGLNLSLTFASRGCQLLIIDNSPCPQQLKGLTGSTYKQINIMNTTDMKSAIVSFSPTLLIHLASMGMSGSTMLSEQCKVVNVQGTASLLQICLENNIPNFINTSSYNVVFGGKPILNGDESAPYFPLNQHSDQYSPSKAQAEQLVIEANGQQMKNGGKIRTASIRPAAIYGEEEQRHLPRIVKHMDNGLFLFRISNAMVDWVHIDNLVGCIKCLCIFICLYISNEIMIC